jgi:hypothetical protein
VAKSGQLTWRRRRCCRRAVACGAAEAENGGEVACGDGGLPDVRRRGEAATELGRDARRRGQAVRSRRFGKKAEYGGEAAVRAEARCAEKQSAVFRRAAAQRAGGGGRRGGGRRAEAAGEARVCGCAAGRRR